MPCSLQAVASTRPTPPRPARTSAEITLRLMSFSTLTMSAAAEKACSCQNMSLFFQAQAGPHREKANYRQQETPAPSCWQLKPAGLVRASWPNAGRTCALVAPAARAAAPVSRPGRSTVFTSSSEWEPDSCSRTSIWVRMPYLGGERRCRRAGGPLYVRHYNTKEEGKSI